MPAVAMAVSPCGPRSRNPFCSLRPMATGARGSPSIRGARFESSPATGPSTTRVVQKT